MAFDFPLGGSFCYICECKFGAIAVRLVVAEGLRNGEAAGVFVRTCKERDGKAKGTKQSGRVSVTGQRPARHGHGTYKPAKADK